MKEMVNGQKNNKKIIFWSIALCVAAAVLCYTFVVLYFFFISPNNISMKFALWPFLSDEAVADICQDAVVEIKLFPSETTSKEGEQGAIVGVNVKEEGLVLAPYHPFKHENAQIQIYNNVGKVFDGEIVFFDQDLDFALLRCKKLNKDDKSDIKMPFASIISKDYVIQKGSSVLTVSSPLSSNYVFNSQISNYFADVPILTSVESFSGVDVVLENSNIMEIDETSHDFSAGAVFDFSGNFIGFASQDAKDEKNNFAIQDVKLANLFLKELDSNGNFDKQQKAPLSDKFVGLDKNEFATHKEVSNSENGRKQFLYFHNQWHEISNNLSAFSIREVDGIFLLQDFVVPEGKIKEGAVLTLCVVNGRKFQIKNKVDLLNVIYYAKSGANVQAQFISFDVSEPEYISFVA